MKNFMIIVNELKDSKLEVTHRLEDYIRKKGGTCSHIISVDQKSGIQKVIPQNILSKTECLLVLGGDGTLIRAVRDTVSCRIPLLGINMGTLGYLCETDAAGAFEVIDAVFRNEFMLEKRLMLSGDFHGKKFLAFNDIVLHRSGRLAMISLKVSVNGEYLASFKGDGMIISTPTGSTGYNLSANGPIVDPTAQLLLLTPINSHSLSSKSIVIGDENEIVIELDSRRPKKDETVEVSCDGDGAIQMRVGDRIVIRKACQEAQIIKLSKISFLQNLSRKMQIYDN